MSDPGPITAPDLPDGASRCGNCGGTVSRDDVVCPACGVLLAAYRAPDGATVGTRAATRPVASPAPETDALSAMPDPMPASPPPPAVPSLSATPRHTPRSMSPIGDALNRMRRAETTIGTMSDGLASMDAADELATMATSDSELSRQIDAQLSGAKATFDGATPAITSDPDAAPTPSAPATVPVPAAARGNASQPAATARTASQPAPVTRATGERAAQAAAIERIRLAREEQRMRDATVSGTPSAPMGTIERLENRASWRERDLGKIISVAPFILILIFILVGFNRVMALVGIAFAIGAGLLLVIVLLNLTSRTGRKTGDMPKDDRFDGWR